MKVLWLTNIPSPYRVDFFNELGKLCQLTVLFERNASKERDESWKHFSSDYFTPIVLQGKSIGVAEAFCPSIIKYLTPEYDRIVVTNYSDLTGMLAVHMLKRRHIPYCLESDGAFPGTGIGIKEKIKRWVISGADMYFSTARMHDDYYKFYGAPEDRIVRYPFSSLKKEDIEEKVLEKNEKMIIREALGMKEEKILLSVGQFIYRKGFDLLIKATANMNGIGVYIVGGTPTEEYIGLCKELKADNIHFVPFKGKKELKKYYQAADVFVHPTREDIWGLVINEAMANGLAVVTTNRCIAGLEMIHEGENGYIVPVNSSDELKEKIQEAISQCAAMGRQSLKAAKHYTVDEMALAHMKAWGKQ